MNNYDNSMIRDVIINNNRGDEGTIEPRLVSSPQAIITGW